MSCSQIAISKQPQKYKGCFDWNVILIINQYKYDQFFLKDFDTTGYGCTSIKYVIISQLKLLVNKIKNVHGHIFVINNFKTVIKLKKPILNVNKRKVNALPMELLVSHCQNALLIVKLYVIKELMVFCIFSYPIEGNSSVKSCRLMVCQDIYNGQNNQSSKISYQIYKVFLMVFIIFLKHNAIFTQLLQFAKEEVLIVINQLFVYLSLIKIILKLVFLKHSLHVQMQKRMNLYVKLIQYQVLMVQNIICLYENGKCQTNDPKTISESKACLIKSAYIHTWNSITNQFETCFMEILLKIKTKQTQLLYCLYLQQQS